VRGLERRAHMLIPAWRAMLAALEEEPREGSEFADWFEIGRDDARDSDVGLKRHWIDPTIPFAETVLKSAHGALITSATLRDVGNDASRGRIYLPLADLARHGVAPEDILQRRNSAGFRRLAAEIAQRARGFYLQARSLLPADHRSPMLTAEIMGAVYWRLLRRIEQTNFDVLADEPLRLTKARKLSLVLLTWCRVKTGLPLASYGA